MLSALRKGFGEHALILADHHVEENSENSAIWRKIAELLRE